METSNRVPESWFMILLQDTCRDSSRGQILTTTVLLEIHMKRVHMLVD